MRKRDLYIVVFWIAFGVFISVWAYLKLGIGKLNAPGSGLMPFLLGLLFSLLSLCALIRLIRHKDQNGITKQEKKRGSREIVYGKVALAVAALFAYALLLEPLGFILTTFLTMTLLFWSAGVKKWVISGAYSGAVVAITYFLFTYLGVRFPPGILQALGLY